ncbi:MAG TPA: host-nuclease inhibitor Gam family protein [Candidatus Paceibacterota bacterium]|nr:host-nuclease inhibitor Gam family protein [Candidatus Paceibacterota bacterium]
MALATTSTTAAPVKTKAEASHAARRVTSLLVKIQREAAKRDTRIKKIESESNARIDACKAEIFLIGEQLFKFWKRNKKKLEAESKSQTVPIATAIVRWYRTRKAAKISVPEEELIKTIEERLPNPEPYITVSKKLNRNGLVNASVKLTRLKLEGLSFESGRAFSIAPKSGSYYAVRNMETGAWSIVTPRTRK